jgi:hypothetical protein
VLSLTMNSLLLLRLLLFVPVPPSCFQAFDRLFMERAWSSSFNLGSWTRPWNIYLASWVCLYCPSLMSTSSRLENNFVGRTIDDARRRQSQQQKWPWYSDGSTIMVRNWSWHCCTCSRWL